MKSVPHGSELPVSNVIVSVKSNAHEIVHRLVSTDHAADDQAQPMPFRKDELNDRTRDLNLSKSLSSSSPLVYERNVYWHQPQYSIGIDNARPNLQNSSRMMKVYCHHIAYLTGVLGVTHIAM